MLHDAPCFTLTPENIYFSAIQGVVYERGNPQENLANNACVSDMECVHKTIHGSSLFQQGFTLIELMIVVVVAAILSTIALPAYQNYVTRGKIPDATSALSAKRVQMEQFFQDNHTYASAPACANDTTTSTYFTFSCVGVVDANNYTLQASGGNAGNQSMAGFTYTINQSYAKTSTIAAPANSSWVAPLTSCWITKTGGLC